MAGIFAGWVVALTHLSHLRLALTSVVAVLAFSLLISLMTGPGYYLRDLALIAAIALSPFIGRVWVGKKKTFTQSAPVLLFIAMLYGCGGQAPTRATALPSVPTSSPAAPVRTLQPLRVTGRVIDSAGNPVAGANVTQWDTANTTTSDGNGAFEMTIAVSAQDRSFWVTVEKPGFETSELNRSIEGAGMTSLRLHERRTIAVGESLQSAIKSDDSACGYHWGYLCRRARLTAPASGTLTVEVVPETATRVGMLVGPVGFPQAMEQRLTMTVNAGSEVIVEAATEWGPNASAGFALSTFLSPAAKP